MPAFLDLIEQIAMFLILALSLTADPQTFTVVNKCPTAFTVVNKIPVVDKPKTATVKVADPSSHIHRCPTCGVEWSHPNSSVGDVAKHTCPGCGKELPRPWWPSERGVRFKTAKVSYREVVEAVTAGETLTVAVGVEDLADCSVDSIPDTEPGLWKCSLENNIPMMVMLPKLVSGSSSPNPIPVCQNFLSLPGSR